MEKNFGRLRKQVFLLSILVLFFTGSSWAKEEALDLDFSVPAPPHSQLLNEGPATFFGRQAKTATYWSGHDSKAIFLHYSLFFKSKGFQSQSPWADFFGLNKEGSQRQEGLNSEPYQKSLREIETMSQRYFRFKKEYLVVDIFLTPKENGTEVSIAKYLQPPGTPDLERTPISLNDPILGFSQRKEDAAGSDLRTIPRPPQSTRMMSDSDNWGGSRLIYTTPLSVLETKDFYLQQMPVEGWVIEKEIAPQENPEPYQRALGGARKAGLAQLLQIDLGEFVQQSYLLEFKGSQGRAQITIFPNLLDKGRTSMVSITYERPR